MKSAEEWFKILKYGTLDEFLNSIKQVQSDAFHAGKLEGLAEAKEIVRCHADIFNVELVKEIEELK